MAVAYFLHGSTSTCPQPWLRNPSPPCPQPVRFLTATNIFLSPKPFQNPNRTLRLGKSSSQCLVPPPPPLDFSTTTDNNKKPPPSAVASALVETLRRGAATLVVVLAVAIGTAPFALALTGGQMGGCCSSSSSSSSSSSDSSSSSSSFSYEYDDDDEDEEDSDGEGDCHKFLLAFVVSTILALVIEEMVKVDRRTTSRSYYTVVQLQVATRGVREYLQKELNTIAATADTSTPSGLAYIFQETAKTLRGKLNKCISAYSYVKKKNVENLAMHLHASIVRQECAKFDEKTLVNTDGKEINLRRWLRSTTADDEIASEYVVVTFVLVAHGVHKFRAIKSRRDLKKALRRLMSISATKIQALDVLWAPQQHDDVLTEEELHERYPTLISL